MIIKTGVKNLCRRNDSHHHNKSAASPYIKPHICIFPGMKSNTILADNSKIAILILIVQALLVAFWLFDRTIGIYRVPIIGAVYEIFWLPVLVCLFISPYMAFIYWKKELFGLRSKFGYLLSLSIILIGLLLAFH